MFGVGTKRRSKTAILFHAVENCKQTSSKRPKRQRTWRGNARLDRTIKRRNYQTISKFQYRIRKVKLFKKVGRFDSELPWQQGEARLGAGQFCVLKVIFYLYDCERLRAKPIWGKRKWRSTCMAIIWQAKAGGSNFDGVMILYPLSGWSTHNRDEHRETKISASDNTKPLIKARGQFAQLTPPIASATQR